MPKKTIAAGGTVEALNFSPKGPYEGLLLKSKTGLIQVNFPKEAGAALAAIAAPGSKVELKAEPEALHDTAAHPVYRLISLTSGKKAWPADNLETDGDVAFAGKVVRLNYALHGEVNGAILENGDFVHTKPDGAKAIQLALGVKIKGIGRRKAAVDGIGVIEAIEVNGVKLPSKPKKKAHH